VQLSVPPPTFFPAVIGSSTLNNTQRQSTTCFPVRCARQQLQAYFQDLGVLVLRVLESRTDRLLGMVFVKDLKQVTEGRPINGFLPILLPAADDEPFARSRNISRIIDWATVTRTSHVPSKGFVKVGEIHLVVLLEPYHANATESSFLEVRRSHAHQQIAEEPHVQPAPLPSAMPTMPVLPPTEITMLSQTSSPHKSTIGKEGITEIPVHNKESPKKQVEFSVDTVRIKLVSGSH
jgi:hypothetical protein